MKFGTDYLHVMLLDVTSEPHTQILRNIIPVVRVELIYVESSQ